MFSSSSSISSLASSLSCSSSTSLYYELLICIGTTLYGISVVTSRAAMNNGVAPATFNSLQHIVASGSLLFFRPLLKKLTANSSPLTDDEEADKLEEREPPLDIIIWFERQFPFLKKCSFELFFLSIMCASFNFAASTFNQYGLVTVEAGKSAFLTSLYVGFTPMILFLLKGSKAQINSLTWVSAIVSIFGSYLLAGCEKTNLFDALTLGEIYTIIGALLWAFSILMTDYSVDRVDCIDLVCFELTISTIFCIILSVYYEPDGLAPLLKFDFSNETFLSNWILIIATGGVEAIAFLLDTIGQIHTSGSRAALLMGMDSVVTVVIAYIFLDERLSFWETMGCLLLLSSTLITTLGSSDYEDEEDEGDEEGDEGEDEDEEVGEEDGVAEDSKEILTTNKPEFTHKKIRSHSSSSFTTPSAPYPRIKSTAQFAGELRKQTYVLLSRRGLPVRTGRRERSYSMHEHPHSSRKHKEPLLQLPSTPSTNLSSSLPNTSSIGYGLIGDQNLTAAGSPNSKSQDDSSIGTKKANELTPLLPSRV